MGTDKPTPSLGQWEAAARAALRDKDLDELRWRVDDLSVAPLQTRRDLEDLPHLAVADRVPRPRTWTLRQRISAPTPAMGAEQIRSALAEGAEEIEICVDPFLGDGFDLGAPGVAETGQHLAATLRDVDLQQTRIAVEGDALTGAAFLLTAARELGVDPTVLRGELGSDPITDPVAGAREDIGWKRLDALVKLCAERAPSLRTLAIDARWSHEVGGSPAQEVACATAQTIETFRQLGALGHDFGSLAPQLGLRVSVSTNLLLDIAKLRALRFLHAKVAAALAPAGEAIPPVHVTAYSSERARARRHDLRTNLLRGTIEAVAATLGGCDALCVEPYDPEPAHQDEAARQLARHQHHLLREEGCLDRVLDPVAGSYAIEKLTDEIARSAWAMVSEIETRGGMDRAVRTGFVHEQLLRSASSRLERARRRQDVLVGISRYADPALEGARGSAPAASEEITTARDANFVATALAEMEKSSANPVDAALRAAAAGATALEMTEALENGEAAAESDDDSLPVSPEPEDVVPELLLSDVSDFEDLRDMLEEEHRPRAVVLATGGGRMASGRADWAADLLLAGGFEVERAAGSAGDAAGATADFEVCVVCADDADQEAALAALRAAAQPPVLAIAGRPRAETAELADAFLFEGGDVLLRLEYLAKCAEIRRLDEGATDIHASLQAHLERLGEMIRKDEP